MITLHVLFDSGLALAVGLFLGWQGCRAVIDRDGGLLDRTWDDGYEESWHQYARQVTGGDMAAETAPVEAGESPAAPSGEGTSPPVLPSRGLRTRWRRRPRTHPPRDDLPAVGDAGTPVRAAGAEDGLVAARFVPGEASHVHERQEDPLRSPGGLYPELAGPLEGVVLAAVNSPGPAMVPGEMPGRLSDVQVHETAGPGAIWDAAFAGWAEHPGHPRAAVDGLAAVVSDHLTDVLCNDPDLLLWDLRAQVEGIGECRRKLAELSDWVAGWTVPALETGKAAA